MELLWFISAARIQKPMASSTTGAVGSVPRLYSDCSARRSFVIPGQNRRRLCALTGSLGPRRTDWGPLVPQSGILRGEPIDLSLERPLLVRHKPALIAIRTALALAHCAGSAIELEKALWGGGQAVAPIPLLRSSGSRQDPGRNRQKGQ